MTNISSTIDGSLTGYLISLALLGVTIVQSWAYVHHNHDKWPLRIFVIVLILLDLTETICATKVLYHFLVNHFGEVDVLGSPTDIISIDFIMTSLIFFISHIFFAYRLWILGKRLWLPVIIALTSTVTLALCASSVSPQLSRLVSSEYRVRRTMIELATFHALAVVTDILITIGLSWVLSKSRTSFKINQMVLQRLLDFVVTRGILITLVQIGHVIMYIHDPKNMLFWSTFHLILTKIYVLTTLVILNSRTPRWDAIRNEAATETYISFVRPTPSMSGYEDHRASRNSANQISKGLIDPLVLRGSNSLDLADVDQKKNQQTLDVPHTLLPPVHDHELHHGPQFSTSV
ncbi:hypothetical protein BDZ94DRAFT_481887 [Collybia nuda]|uniref:DUF6534 domain-containing protein n=1 Tax=Collybia nuda TaxID=64659 RepID=A0A9P5XV03_9AGAR|nr:hypothetical protein BDZ94DRAFT_537968 [Collybia nuda]KAF9455986.1 hypothetical protein BDZ94DRAFT_481887 [Collybia nuda]